MNESEPTLYVWTVRGMDRVIPMVGTLADYVQAWENSELSGDFSLSSNVWEADGEGRLVEHSVEVERGAMTEEQYIPCEFKVNGETVIRMLDGAA